MARLVVAAFIGIVGMFLIECGREGGHPSPDWTAFGDLLYLPLAVAVIAILNA